MIIGITGKMGSGKSTIANLIHKQAPANFIFDVKMSAPLYMMQRAIQSIAELPQEKDRELLQFLGTEWGRKKDPNLWINLYKRNVTQRLYGFEDALIVTDDIRFDNEATLIKELGGKVILVETPVEVRSQRINLQNVDHISEQGIDHKYIDASINNDCSLYELERRVEFILDFVYPS